MDKLPTFKGATCRGSYALGTACRNCERCEWELKSKEPKTPETLREQITRISMEHFWATYPPNHAREACVVLAALVFILDDKLPGLLDSTQATGYLEEQTWLQMARKEFAK